MLVISDIIVNNTRITMFDMHIEFFSEDAATLQVTYVADLVATAMNAGPVIVMGDFNIPVDYPSLDPLFALGLKQYVPLPAVWIAAFIRTDLI
jgi:endonuclease/exonuclease/phosphatase family metal-dependent hydrolase